jgi:hypothetical protein
MRVRCHRVATETSYHRDPELLQLQLSCPERRARFSECECSLEGLSDARSCGPNSLQLNMKVFLSSAYQEV